MWYIYICNKAGRLYTGITTDLTNRMRQHKNAGLIHVEEYEDRSQQQREKNK
ncbi:MAG: hypothetical protein E3J78_00765 [Candidatus Cloacimonadota bacterium]|nr:MAG: hypothetical protein E3J78_00765 [Candidatus Cloacimonadota bacterium]